MLPWLVEEVGMIAVLLQHLKLGDGEGQVKVVN